MSGDSLGKLALDLDDAIIQRYVELGIIEEMLPTELLPVPSPKQASNRTIYERCLEWGCKVTKTNGNWVWMASPFQLRFKIRAPQQRIANGQPDIDNLLNALMLPWSVFMGAQILNKDRLVQIGEGFSKSSSSGDLEFPTDEMGPCSICGESVMRVVMVKRGKKIAHSYCAKRAAEPQLPVESKEETEPMPDLTQTVAGEQYDADVKGERVDPASEKEVVASLPRGRYINSVFDLLVERGDPMSNRAVAEVLDITPAQAGSALAQLASQNVVTRVKSGVYQAKPGLMRKDGTLGLVISGGYMQSTAPTPKPEPVRNQLASTNVEPDPGEDEMLNELLDLMAPNGFKARHLPYIDAFKSCAVALMREINEETNQ